MTRDEWKLWRHGGIGSSDAPAIMNSSPWKTKLELYHEKILPEPIETKTNFIMEKGNRLEPIARAKFQSWYAINEGMDIYFEPKNLELAEDQRIRASLDAYGNGIFAEIKYQGKKDFELNEVPEKYKWQLVHQFIVTGASHAFFIGINDNEEIKVLRVERNETDIEDYLPKAIEFLDCIQNKLAPEIGDDDFLIITDKKLEKIAKEYLKLKQRIEQLEEKEKELRESLTSSLKHNKNLIGPLEIKKETRKGAVNYKKIDELNGVDLEKYRGKSTTNWKITHAK